MNSKIEIKLCFFEKKQLDLIERALYNWETRARKNAYYIKAGNKKAMKEFMRREQIATNIWNHYLVEREKDLR